MELESIVRSHNLRKIRVGKTWWDFLKSLSNGSKITGKEAMFICDSYGIRHSDIIFWMDVMGVLVDMEGFVKEIEEKEHISSLMRQCEGYRDGVDKR